MPATTNVFSYSSAPQPIRPGKKYRNDDGPSLTLMSDPRVIRGTTNLATATLKKSSYLKGATGGTKLSATAPLPTSNNQNRSTANNQPTYTLAAKKYCSEELDLSAFLTEGADKLPRTKPVDTQTDEFNRRPPTPEYVPRKTGIDTSTQIEDTVELFNFDEEVDPMLEIILRKTLEQALLEVCAEEEMRALGGSVLRYEEERDKEDQWMRETEKLGIETIALKDKAVEEAIVRNRDILITTTKVAGLQLMTQLMDGILDNISSELLESGVWTDPLKVSVSADVAALVQESRVILDSYSSAEEVVNELLHLAQERYTEMAAYKSKPRRMELTIFFQSNDDAVDGSGNMEVVEGEDEAPVEVTGEGEDASSSAVRTGASFTVPVENPNSVGPITVDEYDTIASVEVKIMAELRRKKLMDKKFKLYSYVVAALKGRDFPLDACLLNFELPSTLNLIV